MPRFSGMSTDEATAYRGGAPDAYGNAPERAISTGGAPCRCCLQMIAPGEAMLVLAYRPFTDLQPYAETGPIFIHADHCAPATEPGMLESPDYLLKAYDANERIMYGTGQITPTPDIAAYADKLLDREDVAFVDLRSARNNCWQARLTR